MLSKTYLVLIALLLIPSVVSAEVKTYTHKVRQQFGGSQSPDDARIGAIAKAKREVLDKAGTYLESLTIVREGELKKDEILALAAGVLKAEIISEEKFLEGNEFGIYVTAKVDVDTSILDARVRKVIDDRSLLEKLKESKKYEKELLSRIKELERQNKALNSLPLQEQKQKREILKREFKATKEGLTASELWKKALVFWENGKYREPDKALEYLNKAIELNPRYAAAYNSRGNAWADKGDYDRAISDYGKAIELNPRYAETYYNRGFAWRKKGDHDRAISDYDKAIELNPRYSVAYIGRGIARHIKGDHDRAMSDLNKAIELNPRYADAYYNRGFAWRKKGDYDRAMSDFNKAIELNPKHAKAYYNRANALKLAGQNRKAADDYNKYLRISGNKNGNADQVRQRIKDLGYTPLY